MKIQIGLVIADKSSANDRDGRFSARPKRKMICSAQRFLMFLICFGLLAVAPDKASGLISIDLVFRHGQGEDQIAIRTNQRILKAADMKGTRTEKKLPEVVNNTFDPNRSSKRRVRRGPDPIHNRS
ncbi:hypothetical protein E1A91_A05G332300v1 [Gossypium mustelinum]|uniref:Uncharacterized protein n=3 Tax=Gossypium TaxID=3633 RepID=A0A5J5VWM0_GOSBA|nr:hypothetical protein ES319_A05G321100v1 [Gossypium barbadense]TYJ36783.1 hypothetical protein E1A91_A05G332300v1 [Gossypium mustelinum]